MLVGIVSGVRWQSSSAPPGEAVLGSLQGLGSHTTACCLFSLSLVSEMMQKLLVCPQVPGRSRSGFPPCPGDTSMGTTWGQEKGSSGRDAALPG